MMSMICSLGTVRMVSNWCMLRSAATLPLAVTAVSRAWKRLTSSSKQGGLRGNTLPRCPIFTEASQTSSPTIMASRKRPPKRNRNLSHGSSVDALVITALYCYCYMARARTRTRTRARARARATIQLVK